MWGVGRAIATGCFSTGDQANGPAAGARVPAHKTLRVGITPDYPPLVFGQAGAVAGAEIDLARALAKELNRPVEFITLQRDDLINAIQDGRIDIVMSGMSVTKTRQIPPAFSH